MVTMVTSPYKARIPGVYISCKLELNLNMSGSSANLGVIMPSDLSFIKHQRSKLISWQIHWITVKFELTAKLRWRDSYLKASVL